MRPSIHIAEIGRPDAGIVAAIADTAGDVFRAPIVRARGAIDPRPMYDRQRDQYSSRAMLRVLLDCAPDTSRILGVADIDLFTPILTFVFGEAQLRGRAAVISTCRLTPRFYGLAESYALLYERAIKEALHELGHTFGLIHCPNYGCVMHASRVVEEIDLKTAEFCAACRREMVA